MYKVCIRNALASSFRREMNRAKGDEKFPLVTTVFERLEKARITGESLTYGYWSKNVSEVDFNYAKDLYELLNTHDDYKIRIERGVYMWLYSNTKSLIDKIVDLDENVVTDIWDVSEEDKVFLLANQNCVIVKSPPEYEYKIYLKSHGDPAKIISWCKNNMDKIRIGEQCLDNMSVGWVDGNYFFVRDEKVLMLVRMMIGDSITRIERQVYQDDLDKYTYESKQ